MTDFVDSNGIERTDPLVTLQNSVTATGNGASINVRGMEGLLLHVTGITTATITVVGTDPNGNTTNLTVKDATTGTSGSTIIANGFYYVEFVGLSTIQAQITSYTSGTIVATAAPASVVINSGNTSTTVGDGSNTVEGSTTDAANTTGTTGTISGKLRGLVTIFADIWDSVNHFFKVSQATLIWGEDPIAQVMRVEEQFDAVQISASTVVKTGTGRLGGIFVSAASGSPTITVYDNTTGTTNKVIDTFTPVAATHYRFSTHRYTNGINVVIGGTVSATVFKN